MNKQIIPQGYKQTKVGVIPDYWKESLFNDIFIFSTGKNIKQNEASTEFAIPCVRYGELYHMYNEVIDNIINKTNLDKSELLFSKGNEILLPSAGEDPLDIGSASALTLKDIAIGRTINILRPKNKDIYSQKYMAYYINHQLKRKIASLSKGSSISNVYNSDLKILKIPLPPLKEQKKIATILTTWDDAITKQEELIKQKENLKKGLMQRLLSGEVRFDGFSDEWKFIKLGELLDYIQPTKYLVANKNYDSSYKTPVLTAGKTFILGYTKEEHGIFKDNLPVIIFDDFTTASKFVDFPFKAKSSAMKILKAKNEDVNIRLVFEMIQMINYISEDHKRYWISEYQELEIKLPSLPEQQKIAEVLSNADKEIELLKHELLELKAQKKGLMQKLLTGEVRVKEEIQ